MLEPLSEALQHHKHMSTPFTHLLALMDKVLDAMIGKVKMGVNLDLFSSVDIQELINRLLDYLNQLFVTFLAQNWFVNYNPLMRFPILFNV